MFILTQYLEGGSKFNPEHRSIKRMREMTEENNA